MKNFSKLLGLSVALSLVFGMTAFAAESPTTADGKNQTVLDEQAEALQKANSEYTIAAPNVNQYDFVADLQNASSVNNAGILSTAAKALDVEKVDSVKLVGNPFDLTGKGGQTVTGEVTLSGITVNNTSKYVMLHINDDWKQYEMLPVTVNSNGTISFTVNSNSMFALFEVLGITDKDNGSDDDDDDDAPAVTATGAPASPKTGETLPVAGIVMMIALAGAAVCATKVRYNN